MKTEKINILFICKYNRFRSKVAEAYFNKINKNKNIKASSAGIIQGYPINSNTKKILRTLKINLRGEPRGLSSKLIYQQNIIVIVADNVPANLFKNKSGRKIIVWKIKDASEKDDKEIKKVSMEIIKRVDSLVNKLKEAEK